MFYAGPHQAHRRCTDPAAQTQVMHADTVLANAMHYRFYAIIISDILIPTVVAEPFRGLLAVCQFIS
jgi:hypothetical protein